MGKFMNSVRSIRTTAVSPSRVVKVEIATGETPRVAFHALALRQHDEQSLGGEIERALADAQRDYGQRLERLLPAAKQQSHHDPENQRRQRRYAEEVTATRISATSPHGYLRATITGSDGIRIRLRPRALSHIGHDTDLLAREANAVVESAHEALDARLNGIHEATFTGGRR